MATVTGGNNESSIGVIQGSSGEDVFKTGPEDTGGIVITPGSGNDKIIIDPATTGKVTIDLSGANQGNDTIEGFKPGDEIVLSDKSGDGLLTYNDISNSQTTPDGKGLIISFADGTTLTINGVTSIEEINWVVSGNSGSGSGGVLEKAIAGQPLVKATIGSYIQGTDGNDSILGNSLDNTIEGGKGDDTIDGGKGNDVFLIKELNQGHDTLVNLNLGDKLQVYDRNSDGKLNINDLDMKTPGDVDSALTHEGGNTTINFADGTKVTLAGVNITSFSQLNITLHTGHDNPGDDYAVFQ